MVNVNCALCGREMMVQGAVLIGPSNAQGAAYRFNICRGCYDEEVYPLIQKKGDKPRK
jgi:hypothetical protein